MPFLKIFGPLYLESYLGALQNHADVNPLINGGKKSDTYLKKAAAKS